MNATLETTWKERLFFFQSELGMIWHCVLSVTGARLTSEQGRTAPELECLRSSKVPLISDTFVLPSFRIYAYEKRLQSQWSITAVHCVKNTFFCNCCVQIIAIILQLLRSKYHSRLPYLKSNFHPFNLLVAMWTLRLFVTLFYYSEDILTKWRARKHLMVSRSIHKAKPVAVWQQHKYSAIC